MPPRYDCLFLFPNGHPELPRIVAAMSATAVERFGANPDGSPKLPTPFTWALQNGDELHRLALANPESRAGGKPWAVGRWVLTAHTSAQYPPRLSATMPDGSFVDYPDSGDARLEARQYLRGGLDVLADVNFKVNPKQGTAVGRNGYSVTAYV